ncbi:MAG: hypothetical protein NC253_02575 [Ruminococcus sp.]|nr:hypothetical protein [Ruminococcus sp.]MCM1381103.1 hypothetical protein [Muribaculaceae bacterium]MCM1480436.1 hypothetical protein [Muribaculaceae bacterium]
MYETDKQYDGMLIDQYRSLTEIRESAVKENAAETIAVIDRQIKFLKLKFLPRKFPEK